MIIPAIRTIRIGSTGYVWARITEVTGADVSAITPDLRTISPAGVVSEWEPAVPTEHPSADVIRAGLLHTGAEVGWWQLQARITDNPEVEILAVGGFRVIA